MGAAYGDPVPAPVPARRAVTARRAAAALAGLLLAVPVLAGCRRAPDTAVPATSPAVLPAGTSVHHLSVGGADRTYRVHRPATAPGGAPLPLVVVLHGGFGDGEQAEDSYGWDALSDAEHVLVVYPDGLHRAWNVGGGCCGRPGRAGVDDTGFVTAVVAAVRAAAPVDGRRLYATGISNGGMLTYRLACDTTLFAAVAPDSATLLGDCPAPAPVSVLAVHGTADRTVRYDGGPGTGVARIDGPPVPDVVARWRAVDRCAAPVTTTAGPVTTSAATCPDGRAVELITIAGAGHQWPGAVPRPLVQKALGLDPPSTALDATRTIWAFLAAHPRPA